jgi:hypothetical protein
VLADTNNPNLVPSLILLGATTVPASFVAFIYGRERNFDVGVGTLVAVAFLGGVVGVVTSALLEYHTLRDLGTLPTSAVALIEEAAKLIVPDRGPDRHRPPPARRSPAGRWRVGPALPPWRRWATARWRSSAPRESIAAVDTLLLERGLLSPATHMAWTGRTAPALWHAAKRGWTASAVLRLLAVFALAVALHATWGSADIVAAYIPIAAASLISLKLAASRLASSPERADPRRRDDAVPAGPGRRGRPRTGNGMHPSRRQGDTAAHAAEIDPGPTAVAAY